MRKSILGLGLLLVPVALVAACEEDSACFDTLSCPNPDTTTGGGPSGSGGASTGGSAGTTNTSDSGGTGGATSTGGSASVGGSTASVGGAGGSGGTGGTMGGASGAGGAPGECDDACGGSTPVCDEGTDMCVACLETTDCDAAVCDPESHACVECVETNDCDAGVCDTEVHACVECLETADCDEPTPLCDTEQQVCAECLGNADCTNPLEAVCDAGSCSPCESNADCAHLAGTTVCDTGEGECVECTVDDEAVCGGNSCNPVTRTCTTTPVGTVGSCEPCVADSECIGNDASEPVRRCVPMEFAGELREQAYCLRRDAAGCERPYTVTMTTASISGATEEAYCGIDQESVTCEAVLDLVDFQSCLGGNDAECGCPRDEDGNCTATGKGGLCRRVGGIDNQCTYQCGDLGQCVNGRSCVDQDPDFCQ